MKSEHFLARLQGNVRAAAAVEFALVAPIVIGLMLGMFQVSIGMHNYNSLRGAVNDAARYTIIKFQDETRPDEAALTATARQIATSSPYNLNPDKLEVTVDLLDDSRVAGALEATITMEYEISSVAKMVGMDDIQVEYSRPVFLIS
jgi:Flp pilus assembly protein TadG